jgi:aspartyl-tRNA(Asn)/glutamyl-tRNA(Gln) amidotransferase subunit C
MEITKEEVDKVAKLARLRITEEERALFAQQLSAILNYVEQLKVISTEGIDPTATVLEQVNVFRDDTVQPSLPVDKAVANAPDAEGGTFRVPKMIESR